jgi:ATP-dependent DNA helicase RecG
MTPEELQTLVNKGEGTTVEFKKTTGQLHAAFETICAFLNGKGGVVLIGVTDDGRIIGQDISDKIHRDIACEISKLEPSAQAQIEVEYIAIEKNKFVIAITIKKGNHAPYTYDGRAFLRNQSTTTRMPQHRYEQLIVERGQLNHTWEEFIAIDCTVNNLDENLVWKIVNEGVRADRLPATALREELSQVLDNFNLTKDGQLLNAAMVEPVPIK